MRQALSSTWAKWGTGLIFGVIIITFVLFFGPQTQGMTKRNSTWVAKVDGRTIMSNELAAAFERYRRLSNDRARTDDEAFVATQRQLALNIAAVELLAARAEDAGLAISENELRCFLVNWHRGYALGGERICTQFPEDYPERFRNFDAAIWFTEADGSFTDYYDETVRNRFQVSARDYEAFKGRELLARYYLASLRSAVTVPPGVVRDTWERRNTRIALEYIALNPEGAELAEPTAEEIAAWAATNADAVTAAYNADTERFAEPREARIRRIYIRRPAEDDPGYAEALARYEDALARVTTGGEDFDAVARELSEIASEAEEGGDMGTRTADTISADIWAATETMNVGDVQGVEQQYAWNVIKVEELQEARTRPLEEVRDELAAELLRSQRLDAVAAALSDRASRLVELAQSSESLAEAIEAEAAERAAQGLGGIVLTARTTPAFARERANSLQGMEGLPAGLELPPEPADDVPGIGTSRELARIAFSLTTDAPLHPTTIEVDGVPYIVRLAQRDEAPAEMPQAEAERIEQELRSALQGALLGDENNEAALALNTPDPLSPFVNALIDEALESGKITLRADYFVAPDPAENL
jgi:parvulin-like peptidyl-prolyl isomerase